MKHDYICTHFAAKNIYGGSYLPPPYWVGWALLEMDIDLFSESRHANLLVSMANCQTLNLKTKTKKMIKMKIKLVKLVI